MEILPREFLLYTRRFVPRHVSFFPVRPCSYKLACAVLAYSPSRRISPSFAPVLIKLTWNARKQKRLFPLSNGSTCIFVSEAEISYRSRTENFRRRKRSNVTGEGDGLGAGYPLAGRDHPAPRHKTAQLGRKPRGVPLLSLTAIPR